MHIWLLTHSEELKKANGTGKIVKKALNDHCSVIVWQRTSPCQELLELPIQHTRLIYTMSQDEQQAEPVDLDADTIQHIIILDGTWQQARKMYNQSPYLQRFEKYQINDQVSEFKRRKNQVENGLCTAESTIYLLRTLGQPQQAEQLYTAFSTHNHDLS